MGTDYYKYSAVTEYPLSRTSSLIPLDDLNFNRQHIPIRRYEHIQSIDEFRPDVSSTKQILHFRENGLVLSEYKPRVFSRPGILQSTENIPYRINVDGFHTSLHDRSLTTNSDKFSNEIIYVLYFA